MVWSKFRAATKTVRTKVFSITAVVVLAANGLGAGLPLFLTQTVFADPAITVCAAGPPTCNYSTIQAAINAASPGDTINVEAGTYTEDVTVNKDVSLVGAGAASTTIVATDGNSTPLTFAGGVSGATVSGFTITHSYTPAELSAWNFNNDGVLFGQTGSDNTLENSTVTLSRNGIYINTTENNELIDNTITNNRTGINMTGDFTGTQITGNTISDNWTEGLVMYGTNSPGINLSTVSLNGNTFDQNWYEQVLVKGPTHGTNSTFTGTLNLNGNTFTDSPVTYTTSDDPTWDEPAFAAQIPDVPGIGGTATKPATPLPTLRIYGTPGATLEYSPKTLRVGTTEPYATIQAAVADASAGDTIAVDPGTYSGDVNIPVNNLTIAGTGSGVTLDLGSGYGINLDDSPIVATGFTMSGITVDASPSTTYALKAYKADGITLTNDIFNGGASNTGGGVDFNTTNNVTLNNVTSTGFHKNGFAYTAQYLSTDTPANGITFNGVTASDDGYAGIAFYTMNGSNTSGHSISGVTFSGNNSLTGDNQGLFVEGDSDANHLAHVTPAYDISGSGGAPVDLGTTAFSGNTQDIDNYQTNDLDALSATFGGLTGNEMTAVQHQTEDSSIIDQLDYASFGLVKYHTTSAPLPAPTNLAPASGTYTNNDQFDDSWNPVAGAVKYEYHWSASSATDGNGALSGTIGWDDSGTYDQSTPGTVIRHNGPTTDGVYYWQVRAIDSEGNPGAWSVVNKVTVDTTPPVVTVTPVAGSLLHGTETFHITVTDQNLDPSTLTHIWVYLYNSGGTQKSQGANVDLSSGSGTFTVDTTKLDDGNAWLDVGKLYDAAGNPSGSGDTYFKNYTIDNTKPTISFVHPADNSYQRGPFNVEVKASDNLALSLVTVHVYDSTNSHLLGTCGTDSNINAASDTLTCNLNLANSPYGGDGVYYLRAGASDTAGNIQTASEKVTFDATKPSVNITSPANHALLSGTATLNGTVTDANPDYYGFTVKDSHGHTVYSSGNVHGSSVSPVSWDTTKVSDGNYRIELYARDLAGNHNSQTINVTVDNTAPSVPRNGRPNTSYENTNDFYFTWNASHDRHGPVTYEYQASLNPAQSGGVLTTGLWQSGTLTSPTIHSTGAPDGTWYWQVRAIDAAGNTSAWSSIWKVTIDTVPPTKVALQSPHDYSHLTTTNLVDFKWHAATDASPVTYTWESSNSPATNPDGSFTNPVASHTGLTGTSIASPSTPSGVYYWHVQAKDAAGNLGAWSNTWKVTVDNTSPTASFVFPTPGPSATSFQVQFSEAVKTSDATNPANYFLNNWPGASSFSSLAGHATISYNHITHVATVTFTSSGWYVSAEQQWGVQNIHDLAGNVLSLNPTTAYSTPMVAPTAPGNPTTASPTDSDSVNWSWTAATDPGGVDASGVKGYLYELTDSSNNVVVAYSSTPIASLNATTNVTADGTYTLHVKAVDNAGNVGPEATGTVVVDTVAPPVPTITAPSDGSITTNLQQVTWTPVTDSTSNPVTYIYQSSLSDATNVDGSFTTPAYTSGSLASAQIPTPGTPDGVYYLHVQAVDAAGNKSGWSTVVKVTVDSSTPTTPTPSLAAGSYTTANGTELVSLSSSDTGSGGLAGIYYTTDGSTPDNTGNGTLYTGAFSVSGNETVEAIAYGNNGNASPVLTAAYDITATPVFTVSNFVTGGLGGGGGTGNPQNAGNTGTGGTGTGAGGGTGGTVLGASTTTPNSTTNNGQVKGTSTNQPNNSNKSTKKSSGKFLGLGWWWLLVLAILLGLIYGLLRRRSNEEV